MTQSTIQQRIQLEIVREKHEQIPIIMIECNIDCWIVFVRETASNPDPIQGLIVGNDVVWESAFVFFQTAEKISKIAIVGNFDAPAEKQKQIWDEVIPYTEGISKILADLIAKINPQKIALNYSLDDVVADGLSHGLFIKISTILSDKKDLFTSSAPIIRSLRGRKTKKEIELITKACEITEEINNAITLLLKSNMSENKIQQLFHDEMERNGVTEAWQRVSCPAIDTGPDKEFGHIGPSSNSYTKQGHTLHNDFGVKYHGYCSDIQRMWFFGARDEIPEELKHAFSTVHQAILKASDYIKPGVTGYSVDKVARDYIVSQGYEEYAHALGHQIGTQAHDGGVLLGPLWERYGDTPKGLVEEGNVFTVELHVKTKTYGTVSLEENILVTKDGCEFLVPPQEKYILVE
ncbi:MAG: M24 family metallopeptidase [Candidatus Hodarchaeota archaeon]